MKAYLNSSLSSTLAHQVFLEVNCDGVHYSMNASGQFDNQREKETEALYLSNLGNYVRKKEKPLIVYMKSTNHNVARNTLLVK